MKLSKIRGKVRRSSSNLIEGLEGRQLLTSVVVNTIDDSVFAGSGTGFVSLRDAINTADASSTPTTITFDPTVFGAQNKTIRVTKDLPEVNGHEPVSIIGPALGVTIGSATGVEFGNLFYSQLYSNVTLSGLTFSGGGDSIGGGTLFLGGTSNLTDVFITGNTATSGGAIENVGTTHMTNCVIYGNTAEAGGAIFNYGTLTILNSTIYKNTSSFSAPGIENLADATLNIGNTIVADSSEGGDGDVVNDSGGTINSYGHNFISRPDPSYTWQADDITGSFQLLVDPKLIYDVRPNNETPVPVPQAATGPVVNAGSNTLLPSGVTTDILGLPRISGGTVDIGAVEYQQQPPNITLIAPENAHGDPFTANATLGTSQQFLIGGVSASQGIIGPYTFTINWGDGSGTSTDVVSELNPFGTVTPHAYQSSSGSTVTDTASVYVTDPNGVKSNTVTFKVAVAPATVNKLSGLVYSDTNSDGKQQSDEKGIGTIVIYDDANNNGMLDNGEAYATTAADGTYTLDVAGSGSAILRQVLPSVFTQTAPKNNTGQHATLTGSLTQSGFNFGDHSNVQGINAYLFKGSVFFDANKNGKKDSTEKGLAGWEVWADLNKDGKLDSGDKTAFTDSSGNYALGLLGSSGGSYTLHEVMPTNWSQTTPSANKGITLTLSTSSSKTGLNFGDYTSIKYLSTVAITNGIAGWWTFDSASGANSIINGYTGSLKGGAKISTSAGAPIKGESSTSGLSLNGSGAYVNTNLTNQQLFATAGTYNAWIDLGSTPAKSGHTYVIAAKSVFGNDLDLQIETDGSVKFYTDNGTKTSFTPSSLTGWHMVTAEFDVAAKTRKIFWDGKQVASTSPYSGTHTANIGTFAIGESDVFTGRFFDGKIDEVSLFSDALSSSQVSAIYNAATQ